ncbi:hypothetical protein H6G36_02330 [Anabaena minutissima FACHB-250]|nr:hypothetical protein [Anabaena minutissima FACHB-250]
MQIQNFPSGSPTINDLLLFQSVTDGTYRKSLLSQLPGAVNDWQIVNSNFTTEINKKVFNTSTGNITLTLPIVSSGEIEIFNLNASSKIFVNLQGKKYRGANYNTANLVCQGASKYVRLVYLDDSNGWYPIFNQLDSSGVYPSGMGLWLENGELTDKSGNSRNATPVGANSPSVAVGIDSKNVLRWSGAGNQELQVSPFLSGTTGATLYCVFTVSANTNYNLVRTANIDDYWRFTSGGNGYIGTFRNARIENYPAAMPSSGSHLISIHANSAGYEAILDNVSKGLRAETYNSGDRFRIGTNDKAFNGDIALILVYPTWIDKTSYTHTSCVEAIKQFYPSLPFTL